MWPYPARTRAAAGSLAGGVGTGVGVIVLHSCYRVTSRTRGTPQSVITRSASVRLRQDACPPLQRVDPPWYTFGRVVAERRALLRRAIEPLPTAFQPASCASCRQKHGSSAHATRARSITPRSAPRSMYMAPPSLLPRLRPCRAPRRLLPSQSQVGHIIDRSVTMRENDTPSVGSQIG